MREVASIAIEHVVARSNRTYEQVKAVLEKRMGVPSNTDELARQLGAMKTAP